jgi:uncharacterized protein YjiS (DUF1127 family)
MKFISVFAISAWGGDARSPAADASRRLIGFVKVLVTDIREWRRYRRSLEPLSDASDRDLKDLGLTRQDIIYLRAGHRISRPPWGGDEG